MLRIYISSTYKDLVAYREAVADGLKQLGHLPVGMEDYVAEGRRPLAKCVQDVEDSDVYVGIFAYRYGYVPMEDANPARLSITELELATARAKLGEDRCLIFLVDPGIAWPIPLTDADSGESEGGKRIKDLKQRLGTEFTVSHFKSEQHLAQLVNTAVSRLPPPPERHVRQINYHTVLAYADPTDGPAAQGLAEGLARLDLGVRLLPRALFAGSALEFTELERDVVQSHSALLYVTPTLLGLLKALPDEGARVVHLLYERAGVVIALLQGVSVADLPKGWPTVATVPADASLEITSRAARAAIQARCPTWDRSTVGLPYIVLSMTSGEAADLFEGRDAGSKDPRFQELLPGLKRDGDPVARYGPERRDWKPFGVATAEAIAGEIATKVNDGGGRLGHRFVKLQYYSLGPWLRKDEALRSIYRTLLETGCVAVVDQVSLFHTGVCDAIATFLGLATQQVAVVAMSPPQSLTGAEVQLIERQARDRLAGVFTRFDAELDPTCEFGIAEERRLRRWLNASVPTAVNNLAEPKPDESRKRRFRELVAPKVTRMGTEALLWPDRAR